MAKQIIRGIAYIKMGNVAPDGSMGTNLIALGSTVRDTAVFSNEEGTIQDFFEEETEDPIDSVETEKAATRLVFGTHNMEADNMILLFGGTKVAAAPAAPGAIATLGIITGGSLYTNGTYNNVPLTGGTGSDATANITVAGGAVTAVVIVNKGTGFAAANALSASAASIGGTGSGFTVPVATIQTIPATGEKWKAPRSYPELEQSIELGTKKGQKLEIIRAKVRPRITANLQRGSLAQIDINATVMTPILEDLEPFSITYAAT